MDDSMGKTTLNAVNALEDYQPTLLSVSITKHPDWLDFSTDFGKAAPHKLILSETTDYVERMIEVSKDFSGLDNVEESLDELLKDLEAADEDSPLEALNDDEDALADERHDAEANYAESVTNSTHQLIDGVSTVEDALSLGEEELEAMDEKTRKAIDVLGESLARTHSLVAMLFEQWDGSR